MDDLTGGPRHHGYLDQRQWDRLNQYGGPLTLSALNTADTVVYAATATSDGIDGVEGARRTVAQFRRHRQQLGAQDTLTEAGTVVGGVK